MNTNDDTLMFTSHDNVEVFAHGLINVIGVLTKNEPLLIVKRTPYDELVVLTKHGVLSVGYVTTRDFKKLS